jgi:hypothetical protein
MVWELGGAYWQIEHNTGVVGIAWYDILSDDFKIIVRQKNRSVWYKSPENEFFLNAEYAKKAVEDKIIELVKENKDEIS